MIEVVVDTEIAPFIHQMKKLDENIPGIYTIGQDIARFEHYRYNPNRSKQTVIHGFVVQDNSPYQVNLDSPILPPRFGIVEFHLPKINEAAQIEEWRLYPETMLPLFHLGITPEDYILESVEQSPTLVAGAEFRDVKDALHQLSQPQPTLTAKFLGSELTLPQWNRLLQPFLHLMSS